MGAVLSVLSAVEGWYDAVDWNQAIRLLVLAIPATIAAIYGQRNGKILKGNGRGNLMVMSEEMLRWQAEHDVKHIRLEATIDASIRAAVKEEMRLQAQPVVVVQPPSPSAVVSAVSKT